MQKINIESYSVIYSIDGDDLDGHTPSNIAIWQETENSEESDFDVPNWKHKKFVAILTPEQFNEFINDMGLYAEDVETMGSLGAPGYGFSWSPAISFNSENEYDIHQNAYVTPNINKKEGKRLEKLYGKKNIWEPIRQQIIQEYGI